MAKAGRKRKAGPRTPSGRLVQPFEDNAKQTVLTARKRHARPFIEATSGEDFTNREQRAAAWRVKVNSPVNKQQAKVLEGKGTILDRMMQDGLISQDELAAAWAYCHVNVKYRATNGIPNPNPKAASYGAVAGGMNRPDRLEAARQAKVLNDQYENILKQCGAGVYNAVARVVVREVKANPVFVQRGLAALVKAGF